jgi:hypothetical protein
MKVFVELDEQDLAPLHDIVFDLTDKSLNNEQLTAIWNLLPDDIIREAIHWGTNDTGVRENIHTYLKEQWDLKDKDETKTI